MLVPLLVRLLVQVVVAGAGAGAGGGGGGDGESDAAGDRGEMAVATKASPAIFVAETVVKSCC